MSAEPILAIDVGNSRIKWALWGHASMLKQGAQMYSVENLSAVLSREWYGIKPPGDIICACVAGQAVEAELENWVKKHWQLQVRKLVSTKQFAGLRHAYQQPGQHGSDRWAAMIAARDIHPDTPLCVISCGTATTLDVVDASGQHLGGQIMPGIDLMYTALSSRIPALANLATSTEVPETPFASSTEDAVRLGVNQMAVTGIDRACDSAGEMLGTEVKILITGGGGAAMLARMKHPAEFHPDLVLRGLYLAAQLEIA